MDPKVCTFFSGNTGPNCSDIAQYCQIGFFQNSTVSAYMNTISNTIGTLSFCDAGAELNVYNPCGSMAAFDTAIGPYRNMFNFAALSSQYTLSSLNDCLNFVAAAPTMPAIQAGFGNSSSSTSGAADNIWITLGSSIGIIGAILLAAIGYHRENAAYMIVGYILLSVSAMFLAMNVAS